MKSLFSNSTFHMMELLSCAPVFLRMVKPEKFSAFVMTRETGYLYRFVDSVFPYDTGVIIQQIIQICPQYILKKPTNLFVLLPNFSEKQKAEPANSFHVCYTITHIYYKSNSKRSSKQTRNYVISILTCKLIWKE